MSTAARTLYLIEHYKWSIHFHDDEICKGVEICGVWGNVLKNTLREAVDAAYKSQIEWMLKNRIAVQ